MAEPSWPIVQKWLPFHKNSHATSTPDTSPNCSGNCFSCIGAPNTAHLCPKLDAPGSCSPGTVCHNSLDAIYTPMNPDQIRLLRLPSTSEFSFSENNCLQAELIVADSPSSVSATVEYNALSYSWGNADKAHILLCNGISMQITRNLASALQAIQSTRPMLLWADAVCINQTDNKELSEQVARMRTIFEKARSVIVWLGEADMDSVLALHCIRNRSALEKDLATFGTNHSKVKRSSECVQRLKAMYGALTGLYSRPWLGRTWVRQEIYAAWRMEIRCGIDMITWQEFMAGGGLRDWMEQNLLPSERRIGDNLRFLLQDAKQSTEIVDLGRSPRSLLSVLLTSRNFGVTREQDTFYAVIGMCAVPTTADTSTASSATAQQAITVDYGKPISEVYVDASRYLVSIGQFSRAWSYYKRCPRHSQDLPSWAMDWRSSICDHEEVLLIAQAKLNGLVNVQRRYSYGENEPENQMNQLWIPLTYRNAIPDVDFSWPKLSQSDPHVLDLRVRVLNYVAYLSEYTCDLGEFMSDEGGYVIGKAGRSIHARSRPGFQCYLFKKMGKKILFDPEKHSRRIAILGVAFDGQIALVPATACKGDLIVATSPNLLPLLISPVDPQPSSIQELLKYEAAYEKAIFGRWNTSDITGLHYPKLIGVLFALVLAVTIPYGVITRRKGITGIIILTFILFCLGWFVVGCYWSWLSCSSANTARRAKVLQFLAKSANSGKSNSYKLHGTVFARQFYDTMGMNERTHPNDDDVWNLPLQDIELR